MNTVKKLQSQCVKSVICQHFKNVCNFNFIQIKHNNNGSEALRNLPKHIHRYPAVCNTGLWDRRRRHKQGRVQGLLAPFCRQCRPSCDSTGRWYCSCQAAAEGEGLPTEDPGQATSSEEKKHRSFKNIFWPQLYCALQPLIYFALMLLPALPPTLRHRKNLTCSKPTLNKSPQVSQLLSFYDFFQL